MREKNKHYIYFLKDMANDCIIEMYKAATGPNIEKVILQLENKEITIHDIDSTQYIIEAIDYHEILERYLVYKRLSINQQIQLIQDIAWGPSPMIKKIIR